MGMKMHQELGHFLAASITCSQDEATSVSWSLVLVPCPGPPSWSLVLAPRPQHSQGRGLTLCSLLGCNGHVA